MCNRGLTTNLSLAVGCGCSGTIWCIKLGVMIEIKLFSDQPELRLSTRDFPATFSTTCVVRRECSLSSDFHAHAYSR